MQKYPPEAEWKFWQYTLGTPAAIQPLPLTMLLRYPRLREKSRPQKGRLCVERYPAYAAVSSMDSGIWNGSS